MQTQIFAEAKDSVERVTANVPAPVTLRTYQQDCVRMVNQELGRVRSTVFVLPTAMGKSVIIANIVANWPGRVLVIAHRWELIAQLRSHILRTGELADLEMAGNTSDGARVVVGSVQTVSKKKRLERFGPDAFSLVIYDEAHHAVSSGYRKITDYFTSAKILGCTATADRLDRTPLGRVFESVAYEHSIRDAMTDGHLSPLVCKHVAVKSITLKDVGVSGGDLDIADLDAVMRSRESLHGVSRVCLDECGTRPTLVFATTVSTAKALVETLNAYRPGCADAVFGETGFVERTEVFRRHAAGEFQFMVNVQVLTEGWDGPYVSCIVMARPTKSRALMTQMVGRGFRPSPGKADCLVLDLVDNGGRHKLAHPVDIFTGKYEDKVIERVKKMQSTDTITELLDNAEREERERLKAEKERQAEAEKKRIAQFRADVTYGITTADLFGQLGQKPPSYLDNLRTRPSPGQVTMLRKFGIPIPEDLTSQAAQAILRREFARSSKGLARYKQIQLLARYGVSAENITCKDASARIDSIARNGWQRTT